MPFLWYFLFMNEMDPFLKQVSEHEFTHVGQLLVHLVNRAKVLDEEASSKLRLHKDTAGYEELVQQRAQLIADLPTTLTIFGDSGGEVPQEVQDFANAYASIAQEAIEEGSILGMCVLLTPMGSSANDPNVLETLAAKVLPLEHFPVN